jgi:hypothetical protein
MPSNSSAIRKVLVALATTLPCLLWAASVDAAPVRKAHLHSPRTVSRRVSSSDQGLTHLAGRRADRHVYRQPPTWLNKTPGTRTPADHDAAIQNDFSPASVSAYRSGPALEPLHLLVPVQARIQSHDGFARRSPRAPPACG